MLETVRTFLRELGRVVRLEGAYLFGSYARGDWLRESDVDLVVVSPDFRGMGFAERLDLVNGLAWRLRLRPHLEVIPLTPEELERGNVVVRDAKRYWIRLL